MVVHLDDDFFPQLEKAIEPYQDYESGKTDQWDGNKYQAQDNKDRSSKLCWIDDDEVYAMMDGLVHFANTCLLYTSPSPRDISGTRMPSSA